MSLSAWMSWEGGVDLVGVTSPEAQQPNVIVHVARLVHTPVGSAPAGMLLYHPNPDSPPVCVGFVSTDPVVGAYFGPNIFAGTPFEGLPVVTAEIEIDTALPDSVGARISVAGHVIETRLSGLSPLELVNREPGMMPFHHQGVEAIAAEVSLKVNGQPLTVVALPGMDSVWAPTGVYAR